MKRTRLSLPLRLRLPLLALGFAGAGASATLAVACGSDDTAAPPALAEAGADGSASEPEDAGAGADAARAPDARAADAASDAGQRDANGPLTRDAGCTFNFECQAALRCDCADFPCTCQTGPRGTGALGAPCDGGANGADCASAVCLQGAGDVYQCTDACDTAKDCNAALPVCASIALVGKVCIRSAK